jgi:hypothetical protein
MGVKGLGLCCELLAEPAASRDGESYLEALGL